MTATLLHTAGIAMPPVSPLAALFQDPDFSKFLIPANLAQRHMEVALGYLTEALPDPGMWVGWDEASPEFFVAQGGNIPSWVGARIDNVLGSVPDGSATVLIEYVLNDPFAKARCSHTGAEFRFGLWDGKGRDATRHGSSSGFSEIRFDWRTILPQRIAAAAMAADRRQLSIM
jgi:hypothetical protein